MARDVVIRRIATAVALACAATVALTIAAAAHPTIRARLGLVPVRVPAYRAGERIDAPPRVYTSSPLTVLLFIRGNCPTCQRSQPVFKSLADRLAATPARMVLVTDTRRPEDAAYASAIGIDSSGVAPLDFSALRLKSVPTLVLVDREGRVLYALEGVPSDRERDALLQAVIGHTSAG